MLVSKDIFFAFEPKDYYRVILCYPDLKMMNALFRFMRSEVRDRYFSISGTKTCENPTLEHWSVFEDTKFSKSLYLSIEGKIYAHFEDFFKYKDNKDICERVAMKIENYKTLAEIDRVL